MTDATEIMTVPHSPEPSGGTYYTLYTGEGDYVLMSSGTAIVFGLNTPPNGSSYRFRETDAGLVYLQDVSNQKYLRLDSDGSGFELGAVEDAVPLVPQDYEGALQVKYLDTSGSSWVCKDTAALPGPETHYPLIGKASPLGTWGASEFGAPSGVAAWRHTYNGLNRFSPYVFLKHLRKVIEHQDTEHTGDDYWDGLSATNEAAGVSWAVSILAKIDWWMEEEFDVAAKGPAATHAMGEAASHFYNDPTSEHNELDPKKPPEWSDIDSELGSDPYPS